MKKLVIIICLLMILNITFLHTTTIASSTYARIMNESNLYKSADTSDTIDNIICIIEKSYFVEIISDNDKVYKVKYNGAIGYVKKNDVQIINDIPNTPYPSGVNITIGTDCNLRSSPTTKSNKNNIITTIYRNETNINFIGRIYAEETIDFGGTIWYYISYNGYTGYIYNKYVSHITPIYANTEKVTYKSDNLTHIENPITHLPSIIIILILFAPCILILFILYFPRNRKLKNKIAKSKKIIDKY